jgi:RsiW-degrading membrane proteinase PrsW (M82 family)
MKKGEVVIQLHKPSVNERLFFLLCGGILSVPLTLFIDQYASELLAGFSTFYASLISVAVFAPFIEEFSKIFPLFYRHGETQRSIFNLALFVGLGFGIVEFLTYIFALGASPIERIPGLFFHPASTSITAYGVATKRPIPYYFAAVALHFSNNFLAVINSSAVPSSLLIVAVAVFTSYWLHGKTKEKFIN